MLYVIIVCDTFSLVTILVYNYHFDNRALMVSIYFVSSTFLITCRQFHEENDTSITVHKESIF